MSNSRPFRSALVSIALGGLAGGAVLASGGCSKEAGQVQVADGALSDRVAELERQLRDSQNLSQKASHSADAANLSGATIGDQMSQLNARINKLENELATAKSALAAKEASTGAAADAPSTTTTTGAPLLAAPTDGTTYSDEQIAAFRKLSDEVERRKTLEAQAKRVRTELERAKVSLTPQQEEAVVKLQAAYQDKMRELFSAGGFGANDDDREARRTKMESLRTQFETDLRTIVPGGDADKIVDTMRRGFPGLFPRRENGRGMGGAGN
jgi:DNA repair exonuclease SbcCD ATPase subunit